MQTDEILEERIAMRIAKATDALQQSFELTPRLVTAATQLTNCILNDGKILVIGSGSSAAIGQIFSTHLMHRFERDRPGLPAIALNADAITMSSLTDESRSEKYSRQVKALGKSGDSMLIVSATGTRPSLVQSVIAAHELELPVIALTGGSGGEIAPLLNYGDTEIRVNSDHSTTVREQHLMLVHCLSELIDLQIFG
ncbi:MAG: SIS domain-containing protein [Pseudomonadota bacterium]|nr:SIS domain-containing protein [Pseudomonadota bacterium]